MIPECRIFEVGMAVMEHPVNQHGKRNEHHADGDVRVGRMEPADLVAIDENEGERHQDNAP